MQSSILNHSVKYLSVTIGTFTTTLSISASELHCDTDHLHRGNRAIIAIGLCVVNILCDEIAGVNITFIQTAKK